MRRSWRKLHIGLDANTGRIVAAALTMKDIDGGAEVDALLDQVSGSVASFTADGAYDQEGVAAIVAERCPKRRSSCRRAPSPCRARRPRPHPRSGTAICTALPNTDVRPGRKRPATRCGLEPRQPSAGSSR